MPSRLVFDLETDGFLDECTTVHSLVLRDYDTGEVYLSCADRAGYPYVCDGLGELAKQEIIFGHNVIAFDLPVLKKLYGWEPPATVRVFDTLVAARTRWAHIKETDFALMRKGRLPGELVGHHSLKAWGYRMGILKGSFGETTDWKQWSPEMQSYCERDTLVTRELLLRLKKAGYSKRSMEIEHKLASFLFHMEQNGWPFNLDAAHALHGKLCGEREKAAEILREAFGSFLVRHGKPWTPKRDAPKKGYYAGAEIQKLKLVEFNPASRDHIADRLVKLHGWQPHSFTNTGKPELDEGTILSLPCPEAKTLVDYLTINKRLGQLSDGKEAWIKHATKDRPTGGILTGVHHIHGYINPGGTVTHRASHSHPNLGQVPKVGKPYGAECRGLFTVPQGWHMVGTDMSGIQLRCLAHYMARWDGGAYAKTILEGKKEDRTEIHFYNQGVLGIPDEPCDGRTVGGRDTAKTWFYAYLFGAGDPKLGWTLYPSVSEQEAKRLGRAARKKFEGGLPALGYLVKALKHKLTMRPWITLIDGRRAYVRHEHAVLNTLLQGTDSVLCKAWLGCLDGHLTRVLGPPGWKGQWAALGWVHDEVQNATTEPDVVSRLAVQAAEEQTALFNFRLPLTGESKVGATWADTH